MSITVHLPWPDKGLSPNARLDRYSKAELTKEHRKWGHDAAREVAEPTIGGLHVSVIFYPPDKRRHDLDNCYSSCKAYQDGIFEGIGRDDSSIEMVELRFGTPRKLGGVTFTLSDGELEY